MSSQLAAALLLLFTTIAPFSFAFEELEPDVDGDGVINRFDTCYLYPDPEQFDAGSHGYGNRCDGEFKNDGLTSRARDSIRSRDR